MRVLLGICMCCTVLRAQGINAIKGDLDTQDRIGNGENPSVFYPAAMTGQTDGPTIWRFSHIGFRFGFSDSQSSTGLPTDSSTRKSPDPDSFKRFQLWEPQQAALFSPGGKPNTDFSAIFSTLPSEPSGSVIRPSSHAESAFPWVRHAMADPSVAPELALFNLNDDSSASAGPPAGVPPSSQVRPKAISYSNAYYTRRKIHVYASYATLPMFVAEGIVGGKLNNDRNSDSLRSAHVVIAAGIFGLFGLNSVTGVWNMWEARKDPNGHTKRLVHGILMLGADAGLVATAALAPSGTRGGTRPPGDSSVHMGVAIGSMAVATAGYLYMLFAK